MVAGHLRLRSLYTTACDGERTDLICKREQREAASFSKPFPRLDPPVDTCLFARQTHLISMCLYCSQVLSALPSISSLKVLPTPILCGPLHVPPPFCLALPGQNILCPLRCFMVLSEQLSDCVYSILRLCLETGTELTIEDRKESRVWLHRCWQIREAIRHGLNPD